MAHAYGGAGEVVCNRQSDVVALVGHNSHIVAQTVADAAITAANS